MNRTIEWLRGRAAVRENVHFTPLTDVAALDKFFAVSADAPVILFNHDPYCPLSAAAYRRMAAVPETSIIALIDVAHAKDVAAAVAERTGIRHESPQIIVLRHGRAVWSASHRQVTSDVVSRALARYAGNEPRVTP